MTKEELAKKKGIKLEENTETAAESLITTKKEVKEETKVALNKPKEDSKAKAKVSKKRATPKTISKKDKVVSKAGRPKGKSSTKISLNIPDEYLDCVNIAAGIDYKGNTSSYIVSLIEKDIKANGKIYRRIKALSKSRIL